MTFVIRALPEDRKILLNLNTGFTTNRIYRLERGELVFTLVEQAVEPPMHKHFPLDDETWDYARVAVVGETLVGLVAANLERWNRRAVIWHLYVAPDYRRQGIGQALVEDVKTFARSQHARCLWLETTNLNYPGVQFYRNVGFQWCGLDESLYDPQGEAAGEIALYFALTL